MEHALTLTGQFEPFSVVSVLRLQNGPTPETLRRALDQLQREQPLLNVSIATQGRRVYFPETADAPPIPVQIEPWQDESQWQMIATAALNTAVNIQTAPLMRCVYLYQPGQDQAADLIFIYHHAIMDAASGIHFYHRLLSLCGGEVVAEPKEPPPLLPAADEMLPPGMTGMKRTGRLLKYMAGYMKGEMQYRWPFPKRRKPPLHPKTAQNLMVMRQLDRASTQALVRRSRQERVSLNSIVSTALLLAVHKQLYHNQPLPLRALTFANLRPYLSPPVPDSYFGCYIAMVGYTIFCHRDPDFWATVQRFQAALTHSSKRGDKFPAMIMSRPLMQTLIRMQSFRMATTAVSYPGPLHLQPSYGRIQLQNVHGFISNNRLGPEFTAFAKILFGQLSWDFLYLDADMDQAQAEAIADEVVQILQTNG